MVSFQITDGKVTPTFHPIGGEYLSAEAAAERTGQSVELLVEAWRTQFGTAIPETDVAGRPLAAGPQSAPTLAPWSRMSEAEQLELTRQALYPQLPADYFGVFCRIAQERGLSIYCRHLFPQLMTDDRGARTLKIITTIDALRMIAARTGRYQGQVGPDWSGPDEVWKEVWNGDDPPAWARVGIRCAGVAEITWGKADWESYAPYIDFEVLDPFWAKWAPHQLAKCAEALALRKAFPEEMGGVYTKEEMQQAVSKQRVERPRDPFDQRRDTVDSAISRTAPTLLIDNEPLESEEELISLLTTAGYGTEAARERALANFRGKYNALWRTNKNGFYNRVAQDLRALRRQSPTPVN